MDILNALFRTVFFYFFVVISYRIMGKREISQLQVVDLIVSLLMAELIAISIENINDPMYMAIGPIIALVILEVIDVPSVFFMSNLKSSPSQEKTFSIYSQSPTAGIYL